MNWKTPDGKKVVLMTLEELHSIAMTSSETMLTRAYDGMQAMAREVMEFYVGHIACDIGGSVIRGSRYFIEAPDRCPEYTPWGHAEQAGSTAPRVLPGEEE